MKALIGVLAVGVLAGCSSGVTAGNPSPRPELTVHGSVAITDPVGWVGDGGLDEQTQPGTGCSTVSGYSDIAAGAQVVITDDSGKTLAITELGAGTVDPDGGCSFSFSTTVPAGRGFYGVTVTHRGTVKEPEASMGDVSLTLGS